MAIIGETLRRFFYYPKLRETKNTVIPTCREGADLNSEVILRRMALKAPFAQDDHCFCAASGEAIPLGEASYRSIGFLRNFMKQ